MQSRATQTNLSGHDGKDALLEDRLLVANETTVIQGLLADPPRWTEAIIEQVRRRGQGITDWLRR